MLSPSINEYNNASFELLLPSGLWLTNNSPVISNISVDVGDGNGYRTITPGVPLTVNYTSNGIKHWVYRLRLSNNSYLYAHSQIKISSVSGGAGARFGTANPEVIPITATETYLGLAATGTMTIRYADADLGLRRPLIVAEGFDPGHIIKPENRFGVTNINDFIGDVDENNNLQNILRDFPQFDIIYVDWNKGTDYIQRNALLLEQVIRWVNANKEPLAGGGIGTNVILGQSMGGVIARFALRDMENKGQNHQTRMFISYDAPHQGANVPQGYQHFARHARDLYIQTGAVAGAYEIVQLIRGRLSPMRALSLASEPAARQMLVNYVNDNNGIDNSLHNTWQTELRNMGYPQGAGGNPLRIVAVSNGSECGITQPFSAGGNLFTYQGKGRTTFLSDMGLSGILFSTAAGIFNQPAFVLGTLPGRNDLEFDFAVNAKATGSGNQVYKGKITCKKKILWLIPVNVVITNRSYNASAATLPYDYFPGGQYDLRMAGMDLQSISSVNYWTRYNINVSNQPTFSFVSTASALDIGRGNVALSTPDYLARYVGANPPPAPGNTPFQNFITASNDGNTNNERHISIQRRNGDWLAAELTGVQPAANCTFLCTGGNIAIVGNAGFCTPTSYSLSNLPVGVTVSWSVSPAGIASLSCTNCTQPTLTATGSGNITLTATIAGCNATRNIQRTIAVGAIAASRLSVIGDGNTGPSSGNFCNGWPAVSYNVLVDGQKVALGSAILQFEWQVAPGLEELNYDEGMGAALPPFIPGKGVTIRWAGAFGSNYTTYVNVRARNACGWSEWSAPYFVNVGTGPGCGGFMFQMSPNPASGTVNISTAGETVTNNQTVAVNETAKTSQTAKTISSAGKKTTITMIKLYDNSGVVKKLWRFSDQTANARIDVSGLPAGIYIVEISNGLTTERQKLMITK